MLRLLVALSCLAALPLHADTARLEALREGSMKKLAFTEPEPVTDATFTDLDDGTHNLKDYSGQVVLLNFWATWCAPCRKEMPALDELEAALGSEDFRVVPVATGRNTPAGLTRFFEEAEIEHLPLYVDPKQALARHFGVLGLPVTILIDRDGNEIARLIGDAEWNSDSAKAIIAAIIAGNV